MGFTDPNYWKQSPPPQTGDMNNERYLNQKAVLELPGAQAPQELSIADGRISPTRSAVIVDTEGGGAADDLEVINTAVGSGTETLHNGMLITLRAKDPARVVTVKNSAAANGINTADSNDIVLSTEWELTLRLVGGRWYEVPGRASAQAAVAQADAKTALGRTAPATTASRGIARVATLADMEPGAVVENGPAFLDAETVKITTAPTPHAVLRADENNHLNLGWFGSMLCNVRAVLTTSGTWESPIDGWLKYTIIGGGGPGTSWLTGGGNQLAWGTPGGNTTFSGVTAQGGATPRALPNSSTVANRYRVGGGCAGEVKVGYMRVTKGQSIAHTIGAGGVAGAGTATTGYIGSPGTDTVNDSNGSSAQAWGGNGGTTGYGYGGGGGACGLTWGAESIAMSTHSPGYGHDGGAHAVDAAAVPLYGGNGGAGAVILEYYNPEVVS